MDKFGIFNFLNSFLNLSAEKTQRKEENSSDSPDYLKAISSFFEKAGNKNSSDSSLNTEKPKNNDGLKITAPLQSSMLSTMKSHDNFVKRVLSGNGKK